MMSNPIIIWQDGVPRSKIYDDIYFSKESGLLESNYLFLEGNNLRCRWKNLHDNFHIIETGFGTGLNFFATWKLWRENPSRFELHYTSIEKHPLRIEDIQAAISLWPEIAQELDEFSLQYPDDPQSEVDLIFDCGKLHLKLKFADIKDVLPKLNTRADAWFLDGFSPAKNPDMWNDNLYDNMARLTAKNGTCATFTSAGNVRRGLQKVGFTVTKAQGFGKKRHILLGEMAG